MICPYCNADNSKVINSRQQDGYRWRRYKCLSCGERYTTREIHKSEFQKNGVWNIRVPDKEV